jgi:hypothetical protein
MVSTIDLSQSEITKDPGVPWKVRISYACARDAALFPVVLAFTGTVAKIPLGMPQWHSPATIAPDGMLYGQIRNDVGDVSPNLFRIGKLEKVRDCLRMLADNCKLSDDERILMFDEFKKWCKDLRQRPSEGLDKPSRKLIT